ncbi:TM2 domain-containing protein [Actinoplanes sp. NBRC 101535]|uniref:TM2 domain-containing protein n=1 Tax=Actinoplanes sp. NBRC 101535 TaxID=3032196 RepID=UPI0024A33A25|nr:TM2 domain-containing protein [Actinoplanes sp. NBRC 101535]GLY07910.1 hypothetical protein Acsp01_82890 [Actinoplanes sp. NBRC 101535]
MTDTITDTRDSHSHSHGTTSLADLADLTDHILLQMQAQSAYDDVKKSVIFAYVLWATCGFLGGHRFYLHHNGFGAALLVTVGGAGVIWVVDLFFIGSAVREHNAATKAAIFERAGVPVMYAG